MSAFIECRACGKQDRTIDDHLSDAALTERWEGEGWAVAPTRCPEHVDVTIPEPAECTMQHDPEPWVRSYMQSGAGQLLRMGSGDRFRPREGTCPWMLHYVENPAEFRDDAEQRGLRGPVGAVPSDA